MSNAIYPKYKEALLSGDNDVSLTTGTVKVSILNTDVTPYNASNEFYSDLASSGDGVISSSTITNTTVVNGLFDGDDVTLSSVTGAQSEAFLFWIDTGSTSTSRLVAYIDTGVSGLPIIPNGSDIDIEWNVNGIFQL